MIQLFLLSTGLVVLAIAIAILLKKFIKTEKGIFILFLVAGFLTVVVHYSSLLFHLIKDGECLTFLTSNPNLILPIYPCNVVMICCLIIGVTPNKNTKILRYLIDFSVLFGAVSALVGMYVNVDFFNNPTLGDYDVTKGIVAHAAMFFNIVLLFVFGYFKLDLIKNMIRFLVAVVMMAIIGLYDSAVILAFAGKETMMNINPMFMLHSPFEGAGFLMFPFIAGVATLLLFIALVVAEAIKYRKDKEHIWYRRLQIKHS